MTNLTHIIDGFALEAGTHVVQEFQDLLSSGVKPIIYGEETGGPNLDDLANENLLPQQKIEFGDVTYYMSKVFEASGGRPAFIYYLSRTDDAGNKEIFVHSAYKSNSQNEWRVISHTNSNGWFGKGLGELTTSFPLEIAELIEQAYTTQQGKGLDKVGSNVFLGIPKLLPGQLPPHDFNRSFILDKDPFRNMQRGTDPGQTTTMDSKDFPDKIAYFTSQDPSSLVFEDGYAPNLDNCVKINETQNPIYGKVTSYVFLSDNSKLQYSLNIDEGGRSWIGTAQVTDPKVTRFGVKNIRLLYGEIYSNKGNIHMDLFTPAFEYDSQIIGAFFDSSKVNENNSDYFDATAFTHKIPIVAEFRKRAMEGSITVSPIEEIVDSEPVEGNIVPPPERDYSFGEHYSSEHIIPSTDEMDDAFMVYLNRDKLAGHLDCIIGSQLSGRGRLTDKDVSYLVEEFQKHVTVFDPIKAQSVYNSLTEGFSKLVA